MAEMPPAPAVLFEDVTVAPQTLSSSGPSFPLARVKRIMKADSEVKQINSESVLVVAKATELFLEKLVREAAERTKEERRKTVQYKDLAAVVHGKEELEFLHDIVPNKKVKTAQGVRAQRTKETAPTVHSA
mmetsp:Transcript_12045/g.19464  ORF Transcript_12045/g.19464 Transcript_12045/m.19464 type:complete len:131 (+) Transcript_12045:28-420(+)|eukprot:CAMPEP_0184674366 /NCGR_PEP_ID=MMETSP0308-20130426/87197_1 /TAXON_ID=38269 /ORGANISM="Gloeochaete witrockiana, Strain SAG 46.84" /LENGTH=130 /DNA_ID=CAMNT_0027121957 /DNA_START=26 /DNA_END=418 /DNA_ORIENTATION=+